MNFRIMRVKDRSYGTILDGIKDHLIPGLEFGSRDSMVQELKHLLELAPELCYYSIAFDNDGESDDKMLLAFLLAYVRPGTSVVVCVQFWLKDKIEVVQNKMFDLFANWCELNEFTEIQMENVRHSNTLLLQLGLVPKLTLYSRLVNAPISLPEEKAEPEKEPKNA